MDNTQVVEMLKEAGSALRAAHTQTETLSSQLKETQPKLARLQELEAQEKKRERATQIADTMIEHGQIAPEDKWDKIASLMEEPDLDTVARAVQLVADHGEVPLGELDKLAQDADPRSQFFNTFLELGE